MNIAFVSEKLRRISEDNDVAIAELGVERAAILRQTLSDIDAAFSIDDVSQLRKTEFDKQGNCWIRSSHSLTVKLRPNILDKNTIDPTTKQIIWSNVVRVIVECIGVCDD